MSKKVCLTKSVIIQKTTVISAFPKKKIEGKTRDPDVELYRNENPTKHSQF